MSQRSPSPTLGLLILSTLWAAASLRSDLIPSPAAGALSPVRAQAVLYAIFAAVAALVSRARGIAFPRGRMAWAWAGIGVGLFVIPAALVALAQNSVSNLDRVAAFALTPVFATVLEPHLQGAPPSPGKASLAGALAAVAGVLFLFPLEVPGSLRAGIALCALVAAAFLVAAANCFAVRLARNVTQPSTLPMAALAGGASAICFAVASLVAGHTAVPWNAVGAQVFGLVVIDLPALFLLFWLMRYLAASRMTARYLLGPLLAILASLALQPTLPPARGWLGIALLAGGAGWLIFAPVENGQADKIYSRF